MEEFIPESMKDSVFFYANEVVCDRENNRWILKIDSDDCLVRNPNTDADVYTCRETNLDETTPEITEIRSKGPDKIEKDTRTLYRGRILFSAGFVVTLDGSVVLTRRGPGASVDPCKWTSPAGRCDSTPSNTGTRELYEELLVSADGAPAFLSVGLSSSVDPKSLYVETLRRNGIHAEKNDLIHLDTEFPDRYRSMTATVETRFESDAEDVKRHVGEFWTLYDPNASTLELRRIIEVTVPENISSVSFSDGEYGQPTRLFSKDEFMDTDSDEFVTTDRIFRKKTIEGDV